MNKLRQFATAAAVLFLVGGIANAETGMEKHTAKPGSTWSGSNSLSSSSGDAPEGFMNITVDPLLLLVGAVNISADFALPNSFSIGPEFKYWNFSSNPTVTATSFGAHGRYYFGRPALSEGWQLEGKLEYLNVSVTDNLGGTNYTGSASGVAFSFLGAYEWLWGSGFNIDLGLGFAVSPAQRVHVTDNAGDTTDVTTNTVGGLDAEFNLGWMF